MQKMTLLTLCVVFFFELSYSVVAQNSLAQLDEQNGPDNSSSLTETFTEKIIKISPYGRIFIISNSNNFSDGDYLTIILNGQKIARAICAKTTDEESGIKIIRIYSPELWQNLRQGQEVTIIRGDDGKIQEGTSNESVTSTQKTNPNDPSNDIIAEDKLISKLDQDEVEEESSRAIRTDNLITVSYGRITSYKENGETGGYNHWNGQWGLQFYDNIWVEFLYGETIMDSYPNKELKTKLTNITLKLKYTVPGPFASYLQPYIGYQYVESKSPNAGMAPVGKDPASDKELSDQLANEVKMVRQARKKAPILGITLLKRLTPGWFLRAEAGTDLLNAGIAFEF